MSIDKTNTNYPQLVSQISETFEQGQQQAVIAVNSHIVVTYWKVGQYIVEYEQNGIDGGNVIVSQIIDNYRITYKRRPKMMELLNKV
jgi:UDP-N-acetyl-D-mannosaminuronic acid transferase (WecB/TagA/CpsF family)